MFGLKKLFSNLISGEAKAERQKKQLLRPEFAHIFDKPSADSWVSLDLEMTGLNPKTDYILSVGAVRVDNQAGHFSIDTGNALSLICRPPVLPSRESIEIHGLRPTDVENGMNYETMLNELLPFIGNRPIIGFCIQMDMNFLQTVAKPMLGVALPNQLIDISQLYQQKRYARNPDMMGQPKHLNQLLDEFNIPRLPAHDAMNDAIMTAMLFTHVQTAKF